MVALYLVMIFVGCTFVFCLQQYRTSISNDYDIPDVVQTEPPLTTALPTTEPTTAPTTEPTVEPTTMPTEPAPTEDPRLSFEAVSTEANDPKNWGVNWEISVNGSTVESYTREDPISFGKGSDYFALPGIATFRGNNYRDNASYGTAQVKKAALTQVWNHRIGSLDNWGGCAWTGQPLVVQWDDETKAIMNLYDSKKEKEGLVEVIYATLDGHIYFLDLEDGSYINWKECEVPADKAADEITVCLTLFMVGVLT